MRFTWNRLRSQPRGFFNRLGTRPLSTSPGPQDPTSRWSRFRTNPTVRTFGLFSYYLFAFATWIPIVIGFNDHVAELTFITGPSMYPTFNAEKDQTLRRDLVLNWKLGAQEGLARGMIVTFWSPFHPDQTSVKRIVALEGDVVRTRAPWPCPTVLVPQGHVWVEGDGAPRDSLDSNTYGPIATGLIVGRIPFILLPLRRFGPVRPYGPSMA